MGLRLLSCLLVVVMVIMVFRVPSVETACDLPLEPCVTDCSICDEGDKVPDPYNCRGYYVCSDGNDTFPSAFECEPGEVFDVNFGDCAPSDDPCECPQMCVYNCADAADGGVDYYSSSSDCRSYYYCNPSGGIQAMLCDASTPFFDGRECQTIETRCCRCQPDCKDMSGILVADPLDCSRYYGCTAEAEPELHGTCPDGMYFDSALGDCSSTATCNTICTNVVGSDGCIDNFTCLTAGYFAKCPNKCVIEYYRCEAATGLIQDPEECFPGTVFHPDNHVCVDASNCPYPTATYLIS